MMERQNLYDGISKVAWGYFFLYFNLNIGSVSVLPTFVGYLLFLSAIRLLEAEERELSLLRTLGTILAVWHVIEWITSWGGYEFGGVWQIAGLFISLINLYFQFQLLTNVASIATKYQDEDQGLDGRLLNYRTIQTVLLTAMALLGYFSLWLTEVWTLLTFVMALVYIIIGICLMKALFELRKCFSKQET